MWVGIVERPSGVTGCGEASPRVHEVVTHGPHRFAWLGVEDWSENVGLIGWGAASRQVNAEPTNHGE